MNIFTLDVWHRSSFLSPVGDGIADWRCVRDRQ
jgi:hypothetical protein